MSRKRFSFALGIPLAVLPLGCLSNSYVVHHDELARLAAVAPESRWESVRAVQQVGGDDYPPDDDAFLVPPDPPFHGVYVTTVVVNSHAPAPAPPPRPLRSVARGVAPAVIPTAGGKPAVSTSSGKGKGDPEIALIIAAAVVAGAATTFALAGSEGARYDGWLAVNPDEPLHLRYPDGQVRAVPLSVLSPADSAVAEEAIVYEGSEGRFPRLGRAPLDRAGFTMTTALHLGGVPQIDGGMATGAGGYLHLGGNVANVVTFGFTATADGGLNSRHGVFLATLAPEIQVFPVRWAGVYAGYGWAFRNTTLSDRTRADSGEVLRAGVVGELPLTTRLAIQARVGVLDHVFPEGARVSGEGQLGIAVY
jgi:hypothetical protein